MTSHTRLSIGSLIAGTVLVAACVALPGTIIYLVPAALVWLGIEVTRSTKRAATS